MAVPAISRKVLAELMRSWYDVKVRGLVGPSPEDMQEIRILNRILRWTERGVTCEAEDKHAKVILEEKDLQSNSKVSDLPLPRDYDAEDTDEELNPAEG